ncbi:hypothetical protein ACQKDD_13935 [Planococcus kocurii]|uniref:hypothetical protein n=1 Tax=Planococcus kocurii TaxID=1374 RepID=UPI003D07A36D
MKIRSINSPNINRLRNAFYDYLLENAVPFNNLGLVEGEEQLALYFEIAGNPQVFKFDKEYCIGHEPATVAEDIIKPMLNHLIGKNSMSDERKKS